MQLIKKFGDTQSIALLVANAVGACLYDFAASRGRWAVPEERAAGIDSITGEPFIWFINIFPVVAAFLVINVSGCSSSLADDGLASAPGLSPWRSGDRPSSVTLRTTDSAPAKSACRQERAFGCLIG
jgi:hypothetical protein